MLQASPTSKPTLRVLNTLTKSKSVFEPRNGGLNVTWYACGPTVYDASHMGHARNYITTDILRRVMQDYFGYRVQFIMNITDIDDKIIVRARQQYLVKQHRAGTTTIDASLLSEASSAWLAYAKNALPASRVSALPVFCAGPAEVAAAWQTLQLASVALDNPQTDPKLAMHLKILGKAAEYLASVTVPSQEVAPFYDAFGDILAATLDATHGASLSDPAIFRELAAYWESAFLADMDRLGVLRPSVMPRVSEHIDSIVAYVQRIVANGFGYASGGSVYFDTRAFVEAGHIYGKLVPSAVDDAALLAEGEGALSTAAPGAKRAPADFALWKASRPGEPAWPSPWGPGRPGWHIECSAMIAETALGDGRHLDVHSGGIDLAFPHHDNEIAQAEAALACHTWTDLFLHVGHLHIDGLKMSKSLKNFVTIDEALQRYTPRQLRLLCLLHLWSSTLDFKDASMREVEAVENTLVHFFDDMAALVREHSPDTATSTGSNPYGPDERDLEAELAATADRVHVALCDSFDTPSAMRALLDLASSVRGYIRAKANRPLYAPLLTDAAFYVRRISRIFGLFGSETSGSDAPSAKLEAVAVAVSAFRDAVRSNAVDQLASATNSEARAVPVSLLKACDSLRDHDLFDLGIVLEDRETGPALVKLVDAVEAARMREAKRQRETEAAAAREAAQAAAQAKRDQKAALARIDPRTMYLQDPQYSAWDEQGLPTHDAAGVELSKSLYKKLAKEQALQAKRFVPSDA